MKTEAIIDMSKTWTVKLNCGKEIFFDDHSIERIKNIMAHNGYKQVITEYGLKEDNTYKFL